MGNFCELGLVVAVSGKPGSGKTSLAKRLAEALGLRYVSMGQIFRDLARSRNLSLEEFSRIAEENPEIDQLIDGAAIEEARRGCVVLDGHITAWIARDLAHIKILTYAPLEVRAERVARRDRKSFEDSLREIKVREESERVRYMKYYSIDVDKLDIFDVVINTSLLGEEEVAKVATEIAKILAQTRLKKFKRS